MSHGKRYSAKERREILKYLENHTYQETMDKFEVSQMSLARWVKNKEQRETNTLSSLLSQETKNELQIYLNLIESTENVRAVALVTVAGELILPQTMGFSSIFQKVEDVSKITANLLLCAQGFTSAVVNDQKSMKATFDDISIKTPLGTFFLNGVGKAVLVTLFTPDCNLHNILVQDSDLLAQIKSQIEKILL